MKGQEVKDAFRAFPDEVAHKFGEALREFGYKGTTDEWVQEEMTRLIKGEAPRGLGPALFLKRWLENGVEEG